MILEANPKISVIIPAYNEAERITPTLRLTVDYLRSRKEPFELIVVDDGSSDDTVEVVEAVGRDLPEVRCVENPRNMGKGAAVKNGVFNSRGELVAFIDADSSTRISDLQRLVEAIENGADVAIGSRAHRYSVLPVRQPFRRQIAGKVFNFLCRMGLGLTVSDSQCGFKLFKREAAREIFTTSTIEGFCFDVELLYLAGKKKYRVREVPVAWTDDRASRVKLGRDSLNMFLGLLLIRLNDRKGLYS